MDKKRFAVVYLPKENIYSEIPTSRLIKEKHQCWLPKTLNPRLLMEIGEEPDERWNHTAVGTIYRSRIDLENPLKCLLQKTSLNKSDWKYNRVSHRNLGFDLEGYVKRLGVFCLLQKWKPGKNIHVKPLVN